MSFNRPREYDPTLVQLYAERLNYRKEFGLDYSEELAMMDDSRDTVPIETFTELQGKYQCFPPRKLSEEYYAYRIQQESARQVERTSRTIVLTTIEQYKAQLETLRAKDHLNIQLIESQHRQLREVEKVTGLKTNSDVNAIITPEKLYQISAEIESEYQTLELKEKLREMEAKARNDAADAKATIEKLMKRLVEEKQRADKAVQAAKKALEYAKEKARNGHPAPGNPASVPIASTPVPKCAELRSSLSSLRSFIEAVRQKFPILLVKLVKDELIRSPLFSRSIVQDLSSKYLQELMERRRLYNLLQDIQGNIRVLCRIRPPIDPGSCCVAQKDDCTLVQTDVKLGFAREWEFDRVFNPNSTQETVFNGVKPLIQSVVDGYNVCIFAYGQTGAGKTYTMEGPSDNPGVNSRTALELFSLIDARKPSWDYEISCSALEIYNDRVRDLLATANSAYLKVRAGVDSVPEATIVRVADATEVLLLLNSAGTQRAIGQTNANVHSSRSHLVLTIYVKGRCDTMVTNSKLHLIDLAGSERVAKSGSEGDRLKEAKHINKSLFALGDVLTSRRAKQSHIPFRNSTLTFLLQDSLSGDSKTVMVLQLSPDIDSYEETNCSLQFAAKARATELGPARRKTRTSQ